VIIGVNSDLKSRSSAIGAPEPQGRGEGPRLPGAVELRKLNRTLNALRHSNEAMMHADREGDCLSATCKIITEDCGHAMVWIGYAESDKNKTIRPVAHAGFDEGYLETLRLTWADAERGRGPTGTAIRTGQPAGCRNMLTDPRFAPWCEEAVRRGYACSLSVPLRAKGRAFGAITIYAREPEAFSEDETGLLAELADDLAYAVMVLRAREAHARAEQALRQADERNREELERRVAARTAALHESFRYARGLLESSLDPLVTISPAGKITDVNQATELATGVPRARLIGSNFFNYFTEPARAEAGYQKVLADGLVRDYPLSIRHAAGRVTEVLYNATVYRDEAGRVQGVFAAARDITERRLAEKRRELTQALLELFAHKASGREYFDAVVEVIRNWTGCQCLGIRVLDEQGEIPYGASVGFDAEFLKLENHLSVKTDACFCIRAVSQNMDEQDRSLLTNAGSLRCDDTPDFLRRVTPGKRGRYRGTCAQWGFKSLAVIPIRHRDQVLGAIHLADSRPDCFPPATVEFLESMTPLMGEAIQRFHAEAELSRHRDHLEELVKQRTAELETANRQLRAAEADLHRERDQLEIRVNARTADLSTANRALQAEMVQRQHAEQEHKKLLRRLADAQESERARISRELHDQLGQELTALKLGLRLVKNQGASVPAVRESVGKLEHLAGGLMQAIHRLAWELHPAVLDDLGLEAALRRYTGEWSAGNQVPADFHATGMDNGRLPLDLETALYRVTQEALTNVLRHAKAKRVSVLLERRKDSVSLIIEDDGAGFEAAAVFQTARSRGKLGLLGMRERIAMAGGSIEIESTPGAGTTVFARVPLEAANPAEG
jgi:PAS domain S-box-containing protein